MGGVVREAGADEDGLAPLANRREPRERRATLSRAMTWVLTILGIVMLIVILHELGHFTAAKLVGMRVERFSLFFPPTLLKVKRGETEYAIGAIPFGGYVKITGMNPKKSGTCTRTSRAAPTTTSRPGSGSW